MRKLIVMALVVGCLGVLASVAMAATKSVKVGDNYYVRPSGVPKVTVSKGTKVKWRFGTGTPHTVTVKSGPGEVQLRRPQLRRPTRRRSRSAAPTSSTARSTAPAIRG